MLNADMVRIFQNEEDTTMRYIQPKIIATYPAVSTIQGAKVNPRDEISGPTFSPGAAYESNE
jgi:hypothetical protein